MDNFDFARLKQSPPFLFLCGLLVLIPLYYGPIIFFLSALLALPLFFTLPLFPQLRDALVTYGETSQNAATPLDRLQALGPSVLTQKQSSADNYVAQEGFNMSRDDGKLVELEVPERMKTSLDALLTYVVRDFVEFWYTASISMGDTRFLFQVRSVLNAFINNFATQLGKNPPKEMAVYLIYSTSSTLVRQLRTQKEQEGEEDNEDEKEERERERVARIRRVGTEILETFLPESHKSNSLLLPLLTEILTSQLSKIAQSFTPDYVNLTLIKSLGDKQEEVQARESLELPEQKVADAVVRAIVGDAENPTQEDFEETNEEEEKEVKEVKEVKCDQDDPIERLAKRELSEQPKYVDPFEVKDKHQRPILASTSSSDQPLSSPFQSATTSTQLPSSQSIKSPIKSSVEPHSDGFVKTSSHSPFHATITKFIQGTKDEKIAVMSTLPPDILASCAENSPPKRTPKTYTELKLWLILTHRDELLGEIFQEFVHQEKDKAKQYDLYTHLSGFKQVQALASFGSDLLRDDAITTLENTTRHIIPQHLNDQEEELYEGAIMETMARIILNPNENIFVPLQNWLFGFLEHTYRDSLEDDDTYRISKRVVPEEYKYLLLERKDLKSPLPKNTNENGVNGIANGDDKQFGPEEGGDIGDSPLESEHVNCDLDASIPSSPPPTTSIPTSVPAYLDPWDMEPSAPSAPGPTRTEFDKPVVTTSNISVSVTDISAASAYAGDMVKSKKDLIFMIAVEIGDVPGYIVQRAFSEFERLDGQLQKAVPLAGTTPDFPRAFLPGTTMRTSADLTRLLESYLTNLLSEPRYAYSTPVLRFFEKERTAEKGGQNIFSDLTKGVNRQFTLGQSLAKNTLTSTFSTLTSKVPIARRTNPTTPPPPPPHDTPTSSTSPPLPAKNSPPTTQTLRPMSLEVQPSDEGSGTSTPSSIFSRPLFQRRHTPQFSESSIREAPPRDSPGYASLNQEEGSGSMRSDSNPIARTLRAAFEVFDTSSTIQQEPEVAEKLDTSSSPTGVSTTLEERDDRSSVEGSKTDITSVTSIHESTAVVSETPQPLSRTSTSDPPAVSHSHILSQNDLEIIFTSGMSIIEEAYDLSSKSFSFKRGMLRGAEALLKSSYASSIQDQVREFITKFSDVGQLADSIDGLRDSFWPGGVWYSTASNGENVDVRTYEMKEQTREEARRLLLAYTSSNSALMWTLGRDATTQAIIRVFDMLQDEEFLLGFVTGLLLDVFRVLLL